MRVSVITVCYNSAATIRAALESVRVQTHPAIDYVVIDGGSTDGTLEALAEYRDSIAYSISERDHGIYDAMNKGVACARGDVVYFLNADDRFADETVVEDIARVFEQGKVDLVYGDVRCIADGGGYVKTHRHIDRRNLRFERICHQAVFARRGLYARFGGFDRDYRICADHEWLLRIFHAGASVKYVPRLIADFRLGGAHVQQREIDRRETQVLRTRYSQGVLDDVYGFAYRAYRKGFRLCTGRGLDA